MKETSVEFIVTGGTVLAHRRRVTCRSERVTRTYIHRYMKLFDDSIEGDVFGSTHRGWQHEDCR